MGGAVKDIASKSELDNLRQSGAPVMLHFWASWNLVSSYPSVTDNSVQWCLRKDLPCPGDAEHSSLFINCGGSIAKIEKDTYVEDLNGRGSSTFSYYYKTASLSPQSLKYYGLCMRRGSYKVQLHFAEIMFPNDQTYNSLGLRVFDIYVQVSGVGKPFTRQIDALQVNGSTVEIHLQWSGKGTNMLPIRGVYGPLISAITITQNFKVDTGKPLSNGAVAGIVVAASVLFALLVVEILRLTGYLGGKEEDENEELQGLDLQTGSFTLK
ncbi:unnamed protein product [Thlaspi arvense]|uniref:Malectin domain-containing protein n=1 Tax=Thlaspi arvense TaxID=13288 RepID=A0AAU9RXR5_THLAR|nr:unnamed protein product [Thlaspi arvense]